MSDNKVPVTITNRAPGIQPPVYVAGNYSNPEWVPEPMEYTVSEDGVYTFTKTLQVEPESKIVYKFRVGEGDWWLLNEDAPTVTDDAGNRNNILEAPKVTVPEEHTGSEETAADVQTKPAESTEGSTQNVPQNTDANPEIVQPQPVSQLEVLKSSDQVDPARTSTPEFIKTITEVSESAALLDRSTPEPRAPEIGTGRNEVPTSTTVQPNPADTAAEVADSAALLDQPTPQESDVDVMQKDKEAPSEVAAQVADTAATLDTDDDKETPSEVAAQVSDTAAKLDSAELEGPPKTVSPLYKTLADVKADMKDESLEIAGFSNDHEPVPLFAHECAGLYEDDEVPGADEQGPNLSSGRSYEGHKEDYDDPTLERFPSTRDEIISTVRKVETGLNEDQVSVEGVPLSPVVNARGSPTAEARDEPRASETSTAPRGQQQLSLPPSLTGTEEPSRSSISLQSIAEGAEGAESAEEDEPAELKSEYIADVVEKSNGVDGITEAKEKTDVDPSENSAANKIDSKVEQAETADEVIEVAQDAEGGQVEDFGVTSTDLGKEKAQQSESDDIVHADGKARPEKDAAADSKVIDAEVKPSARKPAVESVITVPSPSVSPNTGLLSPVSDDDEAVIVKTTKGEEKGTTKSGYLTPDRAATPQPEEPGSPREPAPNTANPVAESDSNSRVLDSQVEGPASEPRSPQILVSEPEEIRPDEELLPAATLAEPLDESRPVDQDSDGLKQEGSPAVEGSSQSLKGIDASDNIETSSNVEEAPAPKAPLEGNSYKDASIANNSEASATVNSSGETGPHSEDTATASAREESQSSTLKKRSVARPDPADRTGTPVSITDSHKEAAKGGNWFSAFLRLIFIDFFGGFVRKITGGGRKT